MINKISEEKLNGRPVIKCSNGRFAGIEEAGVLAFKGIPFAKPPVGDLRWRPPQAAEASDELYDASEFGCTSLQYPCYSEQASQNKVSEDCLTLNIWTADLEAKKKPIMFYIHGGGFTFGGSADPLYTGKFLVAEHKDVVMVSSNYRVGMMGFMDFVGIDGGENYPEAPFLGLLDLIQSLKWVHENADSFGGDADNITIFGESAGGYLVSALMVADGTEGLFRRVIAHSGTVNLSYTPEDLEKNAAEGTSMAKQLCAKTGCSSVEELVALSEEEIFAAYTDVDPETGLCVGDLITCPLKGGNSPVPADPFAALENGKNKDVDLIIGTVTDEWRYWVELMEEMDYSKLTMEERNAVTQKNMPIYEQFICNLADAYKEQFNDEQNQLVDQFLELYKDMDKKWQYTELVNELFFRIPSIEFAARHAMAGGKTYMYLFGRGSTLYDWLGACHAIEVAFALHNLEATQFAGEVDKGLADEMCEAWTNFAKTGDPSTASTKWTEYDLDTRDTMIFGNDCSLKMEQDPRKKERELLYFSYDYIVANWT